jgi:hypothetical protein
VLWNWFDTLPPAMRLTVIEIVPLRHGDDDTL